MLDFIGLLLSALIAALVSLIISTKNNQSVRQSQEDEFKRKRHDWFLQKQARDAEDIVTTLERFSKQFSTQLGEVSSWFHKLSTYNVLFGDRSDNEATEQANERFFEDAKTLAFKIQSNNAPLEAWFNHDALRLTVWFEDFHQVDKQLVELGRKFTHLQWRLSNFPSQYNRLPISFGQRLHDEAGKVLEEIQREWKELASEITQTQRGLIDSLREK
jgi:gas vesicle protein